MHGRERKKGRGREGGKGVEGRRKKIAAVLNFSAWSPCQELAK